MYKVKDFIRWALTHVKGAAEPWQYLFGSVRVQTTQATLNYYYDHHYAKQMTRARFDQLTADWDRNGYATDCEGLLDAWLTYEQNDPTDINANMNFDLWCTDRGRIDEITRPWVIGEAVFMMNSEGRMTHIGWICGFNNDEPMVVEACGIAYGVVKTKLNGRGWTHRGLMTKKFTYEEEPAVKVDFNIISPMPEGEPYLAMQKALNLAGYTDDDNRTLTEDGKWGKRSKQAFTKMIADYTPEIVVPEPDEGITVKPIMVYHKGDNDEYTVFVFNTDELPK